MVCTTAAARTGAGVAALGAADVAAVGVPAASAVVLGALAVNATGAGVVATELALEAAIAPPIVKNDAMLSPAMSHRLAAAGWWRRRLTGRVGIWVRDSGAVVAFGPVLEDVLEAALAAAARGLRPDAARRAWS